MAASTRLRSLRLTKIDRVDAGAQPDAHITLIKRRDDLTAEDKTEKSLLDPASLDGKLASIREDFAETNPRDDDGNMLYDITVYDGFVVAGNYGADYWRFDYTLNGEEYEFGDGVEVTPNVTWAAASEADMSKSQTTKPVQKEAIVPPIKLDDIDLSALPEEAQTAIAAVAAERDAALTKATDAEAALAAVPAPAVEAEADLAKALAATTDPNVKAVLQKQADDLAALQKRADEDHDRGERLEKAARVTVFKGRAEVLKAMAPHAESIEKLGDTKLDGTGVEKLASLFDTIDKAAGHDVADAVEAILTKANNQVTEFMAVLTEKGHHLSIVSGGDEDAITKAVEKAMADDPTLNKHKATAKVLDANPELRKIAARS